MYTDAKNRVVLPLLDLIIEFLHIDFQLGPHYRARDLTSAEAHSQSSLHAKFPLLNDTASFVMSNI
jgi:hypothetical protein